MELAMFKAMQEKPSGTIMGEGYRPDR